MTQIPMDRMLGVTYGLAYGDALGRPTEFLSGKTLARLGSPFRREVGVNRPKQGIVTDDTQMSLAVARAAAGLTMEGASDTEALTTVFAAEFIRWHDDPKSRDGKRAPGITCLSAVGALKRKPNQWLLATVLDSKGNGANMRVAPLALRTDWTWDQLGAAAQLQAAMTHGHATALASAHLTAVAVRMLLEGIAKPGETLLDHLLAFAYDQRENYYGDVLGHLWSAKAPRQLPPAPWSGPTGALWEDDPTWPVGAYRRTPAVPAKPLPLRGFPTAKSPQEFIRRGWAEVIEALLKVSSAPRDQWQDPCDVAGGGWIAEEALAAALHTLLCFPGDPTNALRRAAFTSGDSDSIASITGALAGAAYGRQAFPSNWISNIEYRDELASSAWKLTPAPLV
jgi:ADP-ribosylglycohydrolase